MATASIYTLSHPVTGAVRYLGKTVGPPGRRCRRHVSDARAGGRYHLHRWIRSLLEEGLAPVVSTLSTVPGDGGDTERYWVRRLRGEGCNLVNHTDGGGGVIGWTHPPEVRARFSASRRGRKLSPEHREAIGAAFRGRKLTPEHCRKMAAARVGSRLSADAIARMAASKRGRKIPAISVAMTGKPGHRLGYKTTPETRARISIAKTGQGHTAEARAEIGAAFRGETRPEVSEGVRKWWARRRMESAS